MRIQVITSAGARPAFRDTVERRIIAEVLTETGVQRKTGVFPAEYNSPTSRIFGSGTNPSGDDDGDGYTNIEEILHQMAAQVEGR